MKLFFFPTNFAFLVWAGHNWWLWPAINLPDAFLSFHSMPRVAQTESHQHRGVGGMFTSTQPLPETMETESNDGGDN
ncbi:hypothetical protein B0H10DRAFT_1990458 [Mycena sp. CBHHK59/15]|nr:hypothetical protein B0H10DRAFT_1990458 [Mycena sp. CBHHK59/15]